ncbi:RNA polymerase sigma-70 factor [Flavihumibacter rivuli]|uniref:RNA polymerase sigma-70 factor n=1 Tax=Flavihumibacter rivuli TaxID=2838156 RepID=UPI001BDEDAF4|nr:RNA polymerase sigma-70 factor [Flavihumibacter rivuli]ULQ57188.1 RNA polymerase sigma-70 factor [Flavihumibacter rivuli]
MTFPVKETLILPTDHGQLGFEQVFKTYFKPLHAYAFTIVKDEVAAEEMVQNVFLKLWEKRNTLDIHRSGTAYLYRSVYHECLNYLQHLKVRAAHASYEAARQQDVDGNAQQRVELTELQGHIDRALNELPEQCRTIFQMSRFEELKYHEIADKLGLSIKTVENQMGKALKLMRQKLADYLPLILLTLLNL